MNTKRTLWMSLLAWAAVLAGLPAYAQNDPQLTLSAGVEFTRGDYGGTVDIEDMYAPLTATLDSGRVTYRLVVPYLSVEAPEGTEFDSGGQPIPGTGEIVTESGLGDIIASATLYDVLTSERLGLAMDITGKVKFGTADDVKGLGTGENDYTLQAGVFKFVDRFTLAGSLGYTVRGDPSDLDLENVWAASLGGAYKFTPDLRGGLFFDFRQSSIAGSDDIHEISGFVSQRIGEHWHVQLYALAGLTDSSPDLGGGLQIRRGVTM